MSSSSRINPRLGLLVPVCILGLLAWIDFGRAERVRYVSSLVETNAPARVPAESSPTGFANAQRRLVVPERSENSFAWISETQRMVATGEWRLRHVDYENAPFGREVNSPSPYRWWLAALAWVDHLGGHPVGESVERVAYLADPLLHVLLIAGATVLVAWQFGIFSAALLAIGLGTIFPFAASFLPGAPDSHGLAGILALGGGLLLVAGIRAAGVEGGNRAARWFAGAGAIGGFGLWVNLSVEVPILGGVALGALAAAWLAGREATDGPSRAEESSSARKREKKAESRPGRKAPLAAIPLPWRAWGGAGAITVLVCYFLECFPDRLGELRLSSLHPLYGLAWLGAGEFLSRVNVWATRNTSSGTKRDVLFAFLGLVAVAAVPIAMWKTGQAGFLSRDLLWARLTSLPDGVSAASFAAWLSRAGANAAVWACALPIVIVIPGLAQMLRRGVPLDARLSLAVSLGPVLVAVVYAFRQLSWWSILDGMLLVTLVAATSWRCRAGQTSNRWLWGAVVAPCSITGVILLLPAKSSGAGFSLTSFEAEELIERDLAHWLTRQAGAPGAVVFAPPHETTTLSFYGGLRGIGTFAPENQAGFGTSLAIAGVATMEEVQALLRGRGVRYLVIPSWDPFFDDFARLYLASNFSNRTSFLAGELRHWNLPPWLRPIPYQVPVGGGFEGQSVLVFEVVDDQSSVVAASRLAEYLVEVGEMKDAARVGETLRQFPGDVGALTARAQVEAARGDATETNQLLDALLARVANAGDRYLPWDRRVSLAVVLARGQKIDIARAQVARCLAELDERKLRSLTTGSLYGLQVLGRAFGLEIGDPRLRALALDLLPADLRGRL